MVCADSCLLLFCKIVQQLEVEIRKLSGSDEHPLWRL